MADPATPPSASPAPEITPAAAEARSPLRPWLLLAVAVLVPYLGVRLVGLLHAQVVEDHDSIYYLVDIEKVLADGFMALATLGPDSKPFFPTVGAFFTALSGSTVLGARLTSLFFGVLMLAALLAIGRRIAPLAAVAAGLTLLAFNPQLITHSYAVLTEPAFIGTFYVALGLFWMQFRDPRPKYAALVGLVAGLAFLTRLEGVLYLAFFPALQAVHWRFAGGRSTYGGRRLATWCAVFALSFGALALPQVWKVSDQMGRFALNGRQAWVAMLNQDDTAYEETIYGLDHHPGQVNLDYVQANPEALGEVQSSVSPVAMLRRVVFNFDELSTVRLSQLLGAAVLMLFGVGLVDLWSRGLRFEAFAVVAVMGVGVAAPLAHNVVTRHVLVIVPMMLLTAGLGASYVARVLVSGMSRLSAPGGHLLATGLVTAVALSGWVYPMSVVLRGLDEQNSEYHPEDLTEPASIIRSITESELGREPVVVARKSYLPYFAGGGHRRLHLPHTDLEGLSTYLMLNQADFLFLVHDSLLRDRPLSEAFEREHPPAGFELLYRDTTRRGETMELYRVSGVDAP